MAREDPEVRLRLASDLKNRIAEAAKANGRSMNAEIVARLENSLDAFSGPAEDVQGLTVRVMRAFMKHLVSIPVPEREALFDAAVKLSVGEPEDQSPVTSDPPPRRVGNKRNLRGFEEPKPPASDP